MENSAGRSIEARDVVIGVSLYLLTSSVVVLGVIFGHQRLPNARGPEPLLQSFCNYDGLHYRSISEHGYSYHPALKSEVAFFPAYPLVARIVEFATGAPTEWALLIVANVCLASCFVFIHAYARVRRPDAGAALPGFAAAAFGLFPTTCFFRFAYSEALFFLLATTALLGMQRRWPLWVIALTIGFATGTRPVGVALLPPFALHLWRRSESAKQFAARLLILGPMACWGLLAYMAYLDWKFGEPLAFAWTQGNWRMRPLLPFGEKLWKLLTLEPVWWPYNPNANAIFINDHTLLSMPLANPVYFAGAVVLLIWGFCRRRLDAGEALLAAGLISIPYFTRGYEFGFLSMGRFVAIVPVLYLLLADWLSRWPPAIAAAVLALSGFFLAVYSAQFAVWMHVF